MNHVMSEIAFDALDENLLFNIVVKVAFYYILARRRQTVNEKVTGGKTK